MINFHNDIIIKNGLDDESIRHFMETTNDEHFPILMTVAFYPKEY